MAPPILQDHAIEAPAGAISTETTSGRYFLRPGDLTTIVDVWMLLSVLWATKLVPHSTLDPGVAFFGVAAFAALLSPRAVRTRRERLTPSALDDVGDVLKRIFLAFGVTSAAIALIDRGDLRLVLAVALLSAPAVLIGRASSYAAERSLRQKSAKGRVLIVGAGEIGRRVVKILDEHEEYGLRVVAAVDDDPRFTSSELGTHILGSTADLPRLVRDMNIDHVVVAFSSASQANLVAVIRDAMNAGANLFVVPRFFELGSTAGGGDHIWGLPLVRLKPPARSRPEWILKRVLDVALSVIGLIVTAPVMAIAATAVAIESGSPILYKQTRIGLSGQPFEILKFRTMRPAGDGVDAKEWGENVDRVTKVGRFLRRSSIDELPQLFNVLKGEMSLVGPRPERPYFVDLFSDIYPHYVERHRVPAGLTGWSQIHGLKGDTSIEERAVFDNYYIENWSLSEDVRIMAKTAIGIIRDGMRGEEK